MEPNLIQQLSVKTNSRIFHLVIDGLGGLPHPDTGLTELEAAKTPNLDKLAEEAAQGLSLPIGHGITPGSGPAHLSLFGYDPIKNMVGRGILDIMGAGYDLIEGDVAARINFCTIDGDDVITDRRAGRIGDDVGKRLCEMMDSKISIDGYEVRVVHTKEYRGGIILRDENKELRGQIKDTDPQKVGLKPLKAEAMNSESEKAAELFNDIVAQAKEILKDEEKANMILLRGVDDYKPLPSFQDQYKLNPLCIAVYPMYKGVAKLCGMTLEDLPGTASLADQFDRLEHVWKDKESEFDYIFFHVKKTDSAGEDGNFEKKVHILEELDELIPVLRAINPEVIVVTGDHSTPSLMSGHSWHPLPTLIHSQFCRKDATKAYGESHAIMGSLGQIPATALMPLAMANAGKLLKFGA